MIQDLSTVNRHLAFYSYVCLSTCKFSCFEIWYFADISIKLASSKFLSSKLTLQFVVFFLCSLIFFLQRKEVFSNTLLPNYKALFFYITNESTLPFGTTTRCGFCSQGKHGCWSKAVQGQYHCYSTLRLVMALISSLLCTWAATLSFTSCSRSFHFLKIEM